MEIGEDGWPSDAAIAGIAGGCGKRDGNSTAGCFSMAVSLLVTSPICYCMPSMRVVNAWIACRSYAMETSSLASEPDMVVVGGVGFDTRLV